MGTGLLLEKRDTILEIYFEKSKIICLKCCKMGNEYDY